MESNPGPGVPREIDPSRLAALEAEDVDRDGRRVGRRVALGMLGLGAVGVLIGSRVQGLLVNLPGPLGGSSDGFLGTILPTGGRFRIYSVTETLPRRAPADYRLSVSGLVERPLTLTYRQLRDLPGTGLTRDFQCVTGWRVEDVPWKGVKLAHVLDLAGVRPEAKALRFTSFDGTYTESLTLAQARRDDVLVAYEMQGGAITRAHGGPVRLYVAPMYGYKSLKWLDGIELTDRVVPGYWEEQGYDVDAWVGRSNSRERDQAT